MRKTKSTPVALTIAGSDSGGGAGIQADLKTFAALGVHGTSAITCLTAQNPRRVTGIEACSPKMVRAQIEAVFEELPPAAVKTGMLFSAAVIEAVADTLRVKRVPLVVDPVMVATSGAKLLRPNAVRALTEKLFPMATLITPNIPETEVLLGRVLKAPDDLRAAARELHDRFGCAALVKGGHLPKSCEAADFLFDGKSHWMLTAERVPGVNTHGTGCTYSAAIAAHLARGAKLLSAVEGAKHFVTHAISCSYKVGRHDVLRHSGCSH